MSPKEERFGATQVGDAALRSRATARALRQNLRDWTGGPELAEIVSEAVERIENGNARRKLLLGVITYSYASAVYGSEEIERSLHQAHDWMTLSTEGCAPGIRHYRRNHRQKIEQSLAEVLHQANIGDFSEEDFARDATERVNRAIREDSWSLDF